MKIIEGTGTILLINNFGNGNKVIGVEMLKLCFGPVRGLCRNYANRDIEDIDINYLEHQGDLDTSFEEEFIRRKQEIVRYNSNLVFSDEHIREYLDKISKDDSIYYNSTRGLIFRKFGFHLEKPLKVLEIGPIGGEGNQRCVDNLDLLNRFGYEVYWLDILPNLTFGKPKQFEQTSWTKIDKVFPKNFFDVIFTEFMYPEFLDEEKGFDSGFMPQLRLLEKTLSCLKERNSMFFVSAHSPTSPDFRLNLGLLQLPFGAVKEISMGETYELYSRNSYIQLFNRE